MKKIDLRSDTVTKPSQAMREFIANAPVGDDVFYEDPTVNELQEYVAAMFGKEKGLYCTSGTQTNQIAIKTHTQPGDEIIAEEGCHIINFESGAPGFISGVNVRPIAGINGIFTAEQVEEKIRPVSFHYPHSALIEIENTHNRAGGTIFPLEEIKSIKDVADKYELPLHLDGARIWNAHISTGIPFQEYAKYFDSVSVCFSKGLGAPIGSMLLGSTDFIKRAHRFRKMVGGGMRQVGIIAAGALYAVKNNISRLAEDHRKARMLGDAISACPHFQLNIDTVQTNIIIWKVDSPKYTAAQIIAKFNEKDILALEIGAGKIRAVCHMDVSFEEIESVIKVIRQLS